jgi:hypothetical protein
MEHTQNDNYQRNAKSQSQVNHCSMVFLGKEVSGAEWYIIRGEDYLGCSQGQVPYGHMIKTVNGTQNCHWDCNKRGENNTSS